MLKQKKINSNGITLVALVVTIIVLIILAGISINLLLGKNGIITKAKQAKENMELAQTEEQETLNNIYKQISTEDVTQNETTIPTELKDLLIQTNATSDKILKDYKAYSNGELITGTMANNGQLDWTPTSAETLTLEEGYYTGGTLNSSEAYNAGYNAAISLGLANPSTLLASKSSIVPTSSGSTASLSYTATEDCYLICSWSGYQVNVTTGKTFKYSGGELLFDYTSSNYDVSIRIALVKLQENEVFSMSSVVSDSSYNNKTCSYIAFK